ncbi:MAG: putative DNA binding domain-containing protein [Candidatus Cloacimonetes bacterium]|nr:putative DNA binding domain-containing protein [Candidatus Cloacimonadota bacterium]
MEDFVRVDLHIHTPASIKCYEGNKGESEYLDILRTAVEKQIKLIAITDHNTIHGYKELLKIKQKLIKERDDATRIDGVQINRTIEQIDSDLNLFEQVTILPGVELETQDCIHLLVIFNPDKPIGDIEDILHQAGYSSDPPLENDDYMSNWNLISTLNHLDKLDCICLDAHTDCKKGIYHDTKHEYRSRSLSHSRLNGVCYCNETNVEHIQIYFEHTARRQNPIALLQFSDAHHIDKIGVRVSWFRLVQPNYENLLKAFLNPIEFISVIEPKMINILDLIKSNATTTYIDEFDMDSYDDIKKSVCAVVNSGGGYCLIGVSKKGAIKGTHNLAEQDVKRRFQQDIIKDIAGVFTYGVTLYPIREDKTVYSIRLSDSRKLVYIRKDNAVYSVNDHVFIVSSVEQTWLIAESKALSIVNNVVFTRIEEMEKNLSDLKHTMENITIIDKYYHNGVSLTSKFKGYAKMMHTHNPLDLPRDLMPRLLESLRSKDVNGFGMTKGKYIYLDHDYGIRFPHAYVRLSPFRYYRRKYPKTYNIPENSIVLTSSGMSLLIPEKSIAFSQYNQAFWVLLNETVNNDILKSYVMFFKSSFFLWTILLKFGEKPNFLSPDVVKDIKLPKFSTLDNYHKHLIKSIVLQYDSIYKEEMRFLKNIQNTIFDEKSENYHAMIDSAIRDHNSIVDPFYYYSDLLYYTFYGICDEDIAKIESYLYNRNYYLPSEQVKSQVLAKHKETFGKRR